jgi:hypothetical protein
LNVGTSAEQEKVGRHHGKGDYHHGPRPKLDANHAPPMRVPFLHGGQKYSTLWPIEKTMRMCSSESVKVVAIENEVVDAWNNDQWRIIRKTTR